MNCAVAWLEQLQLRLGEHRRQLRLRRLREVARPAGGVDDERAAAVDEPLDRLAPRR